MQNIIQKCKQLLALFTKQGWVQRYKVKWLVFRVDILTKGLKRWVLLQLLPLRKWTTKASFTQWMYWFGFFLCISGFIVLLLGVILHFKPATILTISTISFSGASVCLAIGFTSEIVSLLTNYWQNSVFKIFVSFLGAIAATLSLVVARLLINSFTRVDPSHFPITVSIFTTLFTPFVWWGLSIGLLFLLYIVLIIATPFWWLAFACFNSFFAMRNSYIYRLFLQKRKVPHSDLSFWKSMDKLIGWFGGVAGTLALAIALTFSLPDASINYTNQITRSLAKLLVYSNYQPISDECKNYNQGEWVASLGDISSSRKISVAVPDDSNGYTFQVRSCN